MKTTINRFFIAITFIMFMFYGCTKTSELDNPGDLRQAPKFTTDGLHVYGLLPMTPDQFMDMPLFSRESFPATMKLKALQTVVTLWNPAVRDQGQIGSCTAFCGVEANEILYHNFKTQKDSVLSPAFIYYCERVLINKQKINSDNGAYMINIPQALQKYGDCKEESYVYPTSSKSTAYKTAPTSAAFSQALNYRIGQKTTSYARIGTGDVEGVKALLSASIPVMMGFNVYDTSSYNLFEGLNKTNFIYNPLNTSGALVTGARLLGGHAAPIIGYDDNMGGGSFKVQNSWGLYWGLNGFFYMPYTVFKSTRIVAAGNCFCAYLN